MESQRYVAPDCPGCGAHDAARMSKSTWQHDIACCSDACGERVRQAIREMQDTSGYSFLVSLLEDTKERLDSLKWDTIKEARSAHLGGR